MAGTIRDQTISRSMMFIFLGASAALLAIQWRVWATGAVSKATDSKTAVAESKSEGKITVKVASTTPVAPSATAAQPQIGSSLALVKAIQSQTITATTPNQAKLTQPQTPTTVANQATQSDLATHSVKLVVDLSDRRVYIYQGDKKKTSYRLAVGQEGWETPVGSYEIFEMQSDPKWLHPITGEVVPAGPDNPLGKRWIGFLINGKTHLGFHGTNQEELIGQAVSHGCLRMRNQDVIALYNQVSNGTPVIVQK